MLPINNKDIAALRRKYIKTKFVIDEVPRFRIKRIIKNENDNSLMLNILFTKLNKWISVL